MEFRSKFADDGNLRDCDYLDYDSYDYDTESSEDGESFFEKEERYWNELEELNFGKDLCEKVDFCVEALWRETNYASGKIEQKWIQRVIILCNALLHAKDLQDNELVSVRHSLAKLVAFAYPNMKGSVKKMKSLNKSLTRVVETFKQNSYVPIDVLKFHLQFQAKKNEFFQLKKPTVHNSTTKCQRVNLLTNSLGTDIFTHCLGLGENVKSKAAEEQKRNVLETFSPKFVEELIQGVHGELTEEDVFSVYAEVGPFGKSLRKHGLMIPVYWMKVEYLEKLGYVLLNGGEGCGTF